MGKFLLFVSKWLDLSEAFKVIRKVYHTKFVKTISAV